MEAVLKDFHMGNNIPNNSHPFKNDQLQKTSSVLQSQCIINMEEKIKERKRGSRARKMFSFPEMLQKLPPSRLLKGRKDLQENYSEDADKESVLSELDCYSEETKSREGDERETDLEAVMCQVFDVASATKRVYKSLQDDSSPGDWEKIQSADLAVDAHLSRLENLGKNFWTSSSTNGMDGMTMKEILSPFEGTIGELKREVKGREVKIKSLKDKILSTAQQKWFGGKNRLNIRKVSCICQVTKAQDTQIFQATMSQVKEASKSFTSVLLSLMRSSHWDIAASVHSLEAAFLSSSFVDTSSPAANIGIKANHIKYALESFVSRKFFHGFDHESFHMNCHLFSAKPDKFRRQCIDDYNSLKVENPLELLQVLPKCKFGKFCLKKYLTIVHPKMEESILGDLEHHRQVLAGKHPRSQFYQVFLQLAKSVWLLHLLAFSLDPSASLFTPIRGAKFHPEYMKSVIQLSGQPNYPRQVVGFPLSPGFKIGNGSVIKARIYPISMDFR